MSSFYLEAARELIERLAPSRAIALWDSRSEVYECLAVSEPNVQAAALVSGYTRWNCGADEQFQQTCSILAQKDHPQLRAIAITYLAQMFLGTKNSKVQKILVRLVCDESLSNECRNHAYRALREVEFGFQHDLVGDRMAENARALAGQSIPLVPIDWGFVNEVAVR